jgi:hypothetical protein
VDEPGVETINGDRLDRNVVLGPSQQQLVGRLETERHVLAVAVGLHTNDAVRSEGNDQVIEAAERAWARLSFSMAPVAAGASGLDLAVSAGRLDLAFRGSRILG